MNTVLHITPHMGGGVGKAVSGLLLESTKPGHMFRHKLVCLEKPEKLQFIEQLKEKDIEVIICPTDEALLSAVNHADIVQLEFWNHPAIPGVLCKLRLPSIRILVWCHVSGIGYPCIPEKLLTLVQKFIFTSACSYMAEEVVDISECDKNHLAVISSGGGLDALPFPQERPDDEKLRFGYMGSQNFSKLHPDFVSYLSVSGINHLPIRMIGDETNREILETQCEKVGVSSLLEFRGYKADVINELSELDVILYLLNPGHYGTAENALLEAMSMGIVPIVIDNPAEKLIVEDGVTGLVVKTPDELAGAVNWLATHYVERLAMSRRASETVKSQYSYERMLQEFDQHYDELMQEDKQSLIFNRVFGDEPNEWFRSFSRDDTVFLDNGDVRIPDNHNRHAYLERTKGSVSHFLDYYPDDTMLQNWLYNLTAMTDSLKSIG